MMIGLNVTHQALATTEIIAEFHAMGTGWARSART
jgi:inosine-uridine nucleoside N-ribohydrolase